MKNQSGNLERILQECINEIIADNAQLEELLEKAYLRWDELGQKDS